MEPDFQVIVKGLPEPAAQSIGEAVCLVANTLAQAGDGLDLRRMHRIVITTDFAGELAQLSASTASGNPITYTHEEYGIAVAKVVMLPHRDADPEILVVVDARLAASLAPEDQKGRDSDELQTVVHLLHHELCHVHDNNKMIDAFPNDVLRSCYVGKDVFVRPLAELCWSEYIAHAMSSRTAPEEWLATTTGMLADAIARTKQVVDNQILSYRYHGDVDRLIQDFQRDGRFLLRMAAYTLGYTDGLDMSLSDLSPAAAQQLHGSYFEATWQALHEALKEMRGLWPDSWNDLSNYDNLAGVVEEYYATMGLVLSAVGDGQIHVRVPFRPETIPDRRQTT